MPWSMPRGFSKAQDAINKEAEHLDRAAHGKMSKAAWIAIGVGLGGYLEIYIYIRFSETSGETAHFFFIIFV